MTRNIRKIVHDRLLLFRRFLASTAADPEALKDSTLAAIEDARSMEAADCDDAAFSRARRLLQEAYESMRAGAGALLPFGLISARLRARFSRERAEVGPMWVVGSPFAMESMSRLVTAFTLAAMVSSGPGMATASERIDVSPQRTSPLGETEEQTLRGNVSFARRELAPIDAGVSTRRLGGDLGGARGGVKVNGGDWLVIDHSFQVTVVEGVQKGSHGRTQLNCDSMTIGQICFVYRTIRPPIDDASPVDPTRIHL